MKNAALAIFATLSFSLPAFADSTCIRGEWRIELVQNKTSGELEYVEIYKDGKLIVQDHSDKDDVGYTNGICNVEYTYIVKEQDYSFDGCSPFHTRWPAFISGPSIGETLELKTFTCERHPWPET
ncbi:hypothetical protein [Bdellovibrio sp. HCB337]|uniref:hypothetical protein n=1 Tax=Bdellovibrio sp. HCB337 TaxID=3394358 RepID=UPI0039A4570B